MSAPPDRARTAILNGFGRSLGDGVIGVQALSLALRARAVTEWPVLFRLPGLPAAVQELYAAADLCEVRPLPWDHATPRTGFAAAAGFARVIDLRDFAFDPAFRGVAMLDYFLRHLGLDPACVPPPRRRNAWLAPRLRPVPPPGLRAGYILVCPRASMALRTMPPSVHVALLDWLSRRSGRVVVTQGEPVPGTLHAPPAAGLAGLCGLVAGASLVISVDTAMVHLADAYAVPCLAFFTTHRPEWRVRDYPLCQPVHLPVPGLPEALEFARGPEDEEAAASAWPDFALLAPAVARAIERLP